MAHNENEDYERSLSEWRDRLRQSLAQTRGLEARFQDTLSETRQGTEARGRHIDTNAFQFDHMVVSMFLKVESVDDGRRDLSGRAQVEMVRKCSTMGLRQACLTQPDTMGATYRSNHPTHKKR